MLLPFPLYVDGKSRSYFIHIINAWTHANSMSFFISLRTYLSLRSYSSHLLGTTYDCHADDAAAATTASTTRFLIPALLFADDNGDYGFVFRKTKRDGM